MGQISSTWDKSWAFSNQISVHFGSPSQNVLKSDLKKPRICPIWDQSDPIRTKIWHPWKSRDNLRPVFCSICLTKLIFHNSAMYPPVPVYLRQPAVQWPVGTLHHRRPTDRTGAPPRGHPGRRRRKHRLLQSTGSLHGPQSLSYRAAGQWRNVPDFLKLISIIIFVYQYFISL